MSSLYRLYRQKTGVCRTIPPLAVNNSFITNASDKANVFNSIFASNGVVDNGIIPTLTLSPDTNQEICDQVVFTPELVLSTINGLRPSHAVGPDGFSAYFYKEIGRQISSPLAEIFSLSMSSGKLPDIWRTAHITPIFKKGDPTDPNNYRPISLTVVPCRIMEKIVRTTMMHFVIDNNLIGDDQYGFLPGRSTVYQLLLALDRWTEAFDLGIPSDVILFDFKKAFESVVHSKLLYKLSVFGFVGPLFTWIQAFVTGRTQRVVMEQNSSEKLDVISGVPQGSVLGPLLFIIFLNDLSCNPDRAEQEKFADDLQLHSGITSPLDCLALNEEVNYVSRWAEEWQLPISNSKCKSFHVGKKNTQHTYSIQNHNLPGTTSCKNLGVWFTEDLKFSTHCSQVVLSSNRRMAMVKRCFTNSDVDTKVWAFKVYVRPMMEYASSVWSPYLLKDIDHVESVQRRFTKSLLGLSGLPYAQRLIRLKLDSLELRRLKADLILVFKNLHGLVSVSLPFFDRRYTTKTRGHSLKLILPLTRLDCRKHFFAVRVVPAWNSLTEEAVTASSVNIFKRLLNSSNLAPFLMRPEFFHQY